MGKEATCEVRVGRVVHRGTALLETATLVFRGDGIRIAIPLARCDQRDASGGTLRLRYDRKVYAFSLGARAAAWLAAIDNPKSRLDKLGVKPGSRVACIGVDDAPFLEELRARGAIVETKASRDADLVFYQARTTKDLTRIATLRKAIRSNGAIWVVHTKGAAATIKDTDVFAAAKAAGLVDNKVVAFSATHTAERLVIPLSRR
jgi:hypothetical protein